MAVVQLGELRSKGAPLLEPRSGRAVFLLMGAVTWAQMDSATCLMGPISTRLNAARSLSLAPGKRL